MSIWIDIEDWATKHLPSTPITRATLIAYAKGGMFSPAARKIGRRWHLKDDAELLGSWHGNQPKPRHPRRIDDPTVARIFASA